MPTIWDLPNFSGELFTADAINTPFLTMLGGLTGGGLRTNNFEFPTASQYNLPAAAQPAITENASITAPAAANVVRNQVSNVCQIHHERITLTYQKTSNFGRMSGLNTAGQVNNAPNELDFQIARKLEKMARDAEFSFIQGAYNLATNAGEANTTRGMLQTTTLGGGTNINHFGAQLDLAAMQNLFLTMYDNGAVFSNLVLYVPGALKQRISSIYGFAPQSRNVGGVNIEQIETDFGPVGIVVSRFAPANTVLAIEMSVCNPVFLEVPNKGVLFYEELAKTGASEDGQLYAQIGLDHGPSFAHGALINAIA
jgi:hypothetical protein